MIPWVRQLCLLALLVLLQAPGAWAQTKYSDAELDQLVGPIALYPDVLIAEILPACTYPDQVLAAEKYVKAHPGDTSGLEGQSWDSSVKAVARYPDVIGSMASHTDWVNAMGWAFINQPQDLMDAVQELRAKAKANGSLKSTEQMTVSEEGKTIIVTPPMESQVVYVPQYNPVEVYADPYPGWVAPVLSFGAGLAMGSWLSHGCNWWGGSVCGSWYYPGRGWCAPSGYWGARAVPYGAGYNPTAWSRNNAINAPRYTNVNNNIRVGNTNINSGNTNIRGNNNIRGGNNNIQGGNRGNNLQGNRPNAGSLPHQPVRPNSSGRPNVPGAGQANAGINHLNNSVPNMQNRPNLDAYRGGGNRPSTRPNVPSSGSRGGAFDGVQRGSQVRRDSAQGRGSRASANNFQSRSPGGSSSRPSGGYSGGRSGGYSGGRPSGGGGGGGRRRVEGGDLW